MKIVKATANDLTILDEILQRTIVSLHNQGINQWNDDYPNLDIYQEDLKNDQLYKVIDHHQIIASFVLNQDGENYDKDGSWNYLGDNYIVIHRLCLDCNYQGKGLGKKILGLIIDLVKELGYDAIKLDCYTNNPAAQRLYQSFNFNKVGETIYNTGTYYQDEQFELYEYILKDNG